MLSPIRALFHQLHIKITNVPIIIAGRWKIEEPNVALRKSDWSTEDHCGCDEMRNRYLHEKDQLEHLIQQHIIAEDKKTKK
jgi:hypothetical protein